MKLSIYINQVKSIEWWLNKTEAILVDLFSKLPLWADSNKTIWNDIYYFFAKPKILKECPILWDKIDTIYRVCKSLENKKLIECKKIGACDYWKLSKMIREWDFLEKSNTMSEKNPNESEELGKKSEFTMSEKNPTSSEKNPTYKISIPSEGSLLDNTISNDIVLQKSEKTLFSLLSETLKNQEFVQKLQNKFWFESNVLKSSAENFLIYWTEKNPSGRKEKWEMEKTFDIERRIYARLTNEKKWSSKPKKEITFW